MSPLSAEEVSVPETPQPEHQRIAGWLGSCCSWLGTNRSPKLSRVGHGMLVGRKKLEQNRKHHRDMKNLKVMASEMAISVGGGSTLESALYMLFTTPSP